MDGRKQIIIKEIIYWKENKLLPEQYCQFLLNLYREGDVEQETNTLKKKGPVKRMIRAMFTSVFVFGLMLLLLFFQSYSLPIQGMILIGFSLIFYAITVWMKIHSMSTYHIPLGIASLLILLTDVWVGIHMHVNGKLLLLSLVIVLLIWLITGIVLRSSYIIFIGIIGLMICYGRFVHPWIIVNDVIWFQHVIWYPIAFIGITVGLKLIDVHTQLGRMIFFAGVCAIFVSGIHSFFLNHTLLIPILFFLIEGFIALFVLYYTKERWLREKSSKKK